MATAENINNLLSDAEKFLLQENIEACFVLCEKIEQTIQLNCSPKLENISLYHTKLAAIKRKLNILMIKKVK